MRGRMSARFKRGTRLMDYEKALQILQMAKAIGAKKGVENSVAIVDAAGHPVLVARGKP
jgi:uncharacterized protein GlcG (DUF336 family)